MEERNIVVVLLLSLVTFGIYALYWFYKTGKELRQRGKEISHFIFLFIPFLNLYYLYKYWKAAETITGHSLLLQGAITIFFGPVYPAMIQAKYNDIGNKTKGNESEGLLPLEEMEGDMPSAPKEKEDTSEEFDLDGLDDELGDLDEDIDVANQDMEENSDEKSDEDTDNELSSPAEEESEDISKQEGPDIEDTVEEVDELLREGKNQKEITIKLRGEGKSDELISQAYHVENHRNNYE